MKIRRVQRLRRSSVESEDADSMSHVVNGAELGCLDPFVKFEEFTIRKPGVISEHPHRGVETVTYIWEGATEDEDCFGNIGRLEPGDVQWVTAGRGLVHARVPTSDEPVWGLQIWLNLPGENKMAAPVYQEIRASEISRFERDGASVAVIHGGDALGYGSGPQSFTFYQGHFKLVSKAFFCPFSHTFTPQTQVAPHTAVLFCDGDCVKVQNQGAEVCRFVLVASEPTGEPIVHKGQFVMTTEEEIAQAIEDYENCTNGFEKALNWKSKMCERVRKGNTKYNDQTTESES
ncbi:pirin [Periophthalmus magnuspinnatus]|uniref:pirin n=1 Tax=Periophthalmus magnuspinnatus TaxID=409849 RepID=UPI002436B9FA|nr:pirin [Periophthalmus magnuspinnatus]